MTMLAFKQSVRKVSPTGAYRALHEIADRFEPGVRKAFIEAVEKLKSSITLRELQDAVETGNVDEVVRILHWDEYEASLRAMSAKLREAIVEAAEVSGGQLRGIVDSPISFDILNPMSASYIRQYEFGLITGISDETRDAIRQIVLDAFEQGGHPREQAREIRMLIGLTERQSNAVSNYWDTLIEGGETDARAEELAMRYYGRLLNYRARTIAHTETIRAAGQGRELLWGQAVEQGLLDPFTTRRQWLVTPDDRLCELCAAIPEMNPDGVALNEDFRSEVGFLESEPAHPNCRCSIYLSELG